MEYTWKLRPSLNILVILVSALLLGCGGSGGTGAGGGESLSHPPDRGPRQRGGGDQQTRPLPQGQIIGGFNPLVCATVTAFRAGVSGYGEGAQVLGTATSGPDGSFAFAANVTCGPGDLVYYAADGGNTASNIGGDPNNPDCPAALKNSAIRLMTVVGKCGELPANVVINEVTTVAATYALLQFTSRPSVSAAPSPVPVPSATPVSQMMPCQSGPCGS